MVESISFIHTADLHLDSPFRGLSHVPEHIFEEVRHSTFEAFNQLINVAITKQVDFILLVGDLFDHERQSLKAQIRLRTAFEKLEMHHIHVYVSYGNHDFLQGNIHTVTYPDNVHIFPNEHISSFIHRKNNEKAAMITGFSYENRAVKEAKINEYPNRDPQIPFHIGTLHGSVYGDKQHQTYAPFQLGQLLDKSYDYWALGHIHKRQALAQHPFVIYPGNIQGRHRKESGQKGCYYVEMGKTSTEATFLPLEGIQFEQLSLDISSCAKLEEVEKLVMQQLPVDGRGRYLVYITWYSERDKWLSIHSDGLFGELIDSINERLANRDDWIFIYADQMKLVQTDFPEHNAYFMGEVQKAFSEIDIVEQTNELYNHSKGRKFLDQVTDNQVRADAEQLLLVELLKMKRDESE